MIDWKTSKKIEMNSYGGKVGTKIATSNIPDCNYYHYTLQLSLYRYLLERYYGLKIRTMIIAHLKEDYARAITVPYMINEIRNVGSKTLIMAFIKTLKKVNGLITLNQCKPPFPELLISNGESLNITFLDTETTGTNRLNDEIIEIAIKEIEFEKDSGKIIKITNQYESFNEPSKEIDDKITKLTGIDNKTVKNKLIDWNEIDSILKNTIYLLLIMQSLIEHLLIDIQVLVHLKYGVVPLMILIGLKKGSLVQKQELLCYWHGFYFEAHRAMNDVDALIQLLIHPHYGKNRPILELIKNARKTRFKILVSNFPYNEQKKDKIKGDGYKWSTIDKIWYKEVDENDLILEKKYLSSVIYNGEFNGHVEQIDPNRKI